MGQVYDLRGSKTGVKFVMKQAITLSNDAANRIKEIMTKDEKNSLGVPDTAVLLEGNKKYVYKVLENNTIEKIEIETGIRNKGNLEVVSGLQRDDKIVAEGLSKTSPGEKIKPIINEN